MIRNLRNFLALSIFVVASFGVMAADTVVENGQSFERRVTKEGLNFQLKGTGTRTKFWVVKVYAIGFYTENGTSDNITSEDTKKMVDIAITTSRLDKPKMVEALTEGVNNNKESGANFNAELGTLAKMFGDNDFNDGNRFSLVHTGAALKVFVGDTLKGTIENKSFSNTLFKVWVGENPCDDSLKQKLLGN